MVDRGYEKTDDIIHEGGHSVSIHHWQRVLGDVGRVDTLCGDLHVFLAWASSSPRCMWRCR